MLRFNANLFRLAFGFTSTGETRYYLKGVFVEPHAQGGVTLTAMDGHRLVCIRDEAGQADETAIICLGDTLKQCKPKLGATRFVTVATGESTALITEERDRASGAFNIATAYDVRVDGTFPDYRRVVPMRFGRVGAPGFNGQYIATFGDLARELAAHMGDKSSKHQQHNSAAHLRILPQAASKDREPESGPALILFPRYSFAFGILMSVRVASDDDLAAPQWFRAKGDSVAQAAE